jgi:hypothetical protein
MGAHAFISICCIHHYARRWWPKELQRLPWNLGFLPKWNLWTQSVFPINTCIIFSLPQMVLWIYGITYKISPNHQLFCYWN